MHAPRLRVEVSNFRAIGKADIVLDGITVIAGENSSGKSTLSRLLYHTFDVSKNYDRLIQTQLGSDLRLISQNFIKILQDYSHLIELKKDALNNVSDLFTESITNISSNEDSQKMFSQAIKECQVIIEYILLSLEKPDIGTKLKVASRQWAESWRLTSNNHSERIRRALLECLPVEVRLAVPELDISEVYTQIEKLIYSRYEQAQNQIQNRNIIELDHRIGRVFENVPIEGVFNLYEYGVNVIDRDINKLLNLHSVDEVIYVDTPMAIGLPFTKNAHWGDLNRLLMKNSPNDELSVEEKQISDIVIRKILHGEVYYERKDLYRAGFVYKREDDSEFNLLDCATGVKSFAILQLLLQKGYFNDKTFLLLDEPEAHLHPQWIVEYARFLTLLNKELGVKMLIASHSPDMVSAIKYISEKEVADENLNFYIAEKRSAGFLYDYKHLGKDIDEIFNSYNKSYEKLDGYAE